MLKSLKEALILAILAAVLALIFNFLSPNGIALSGTWYDNREKVVLEEPPSYDPTVDSLLTMQDAFALWKDSATFIDAREPDEYAAGHIPGAYCLPFEEWDDYWDGVVDYLAPEKKIVCYCGGLDCELSLFAARELKNLGYPNSYIFFGGYEKWVAAELPIESDHDN